MKRNITGFAFIVLLLAAAFFLVTSMAKKRRDWRETYSEGSKEPYGSFVIHELLTTYFPNKKFIELPDVIVKSLPNPDTLKSSANYIFIGDGFWADSVDIDKLYFFVHEGHNAFIAANEITHTLFDRFKKDTCQTQEVKYSPNYFFHIYGDSVTMNLSNKRLNDTLNFKYSIREHEFSFYSWWQTFNEKTDSCTDLLPPEHLSLGKLTTGKDYYVRKLNNYENFIKIPYGKGNLYVHCNPIAFSNYCLTDSMHTNYAAKVFSHLPTGDIYWDKKSRISRNEVKKRNFQNEKFSRESPLQYILTQPSLRWAWFLFLGMVAMYLFFYSKRRQRVIPLMPDKSNTSLAFIQSVAGLHQYQKNYAQMGIYKVTQFKNEVIKRYRLAQNLSENNFVQQLSVQSNIPDFHLRRILDYGEKSKRYDMTETDLIDLHKLIVQFHEKCK